MFFALCQENNKKNIQPFPLLFVEKTLSTILVDPHWLNGFSGVIKRKKGTKR